MKKNGFTVLELLIVIIIVGILSGIAVPSYIKSKESAIDREATANLKIISSAEKTYKLEQGIYYNSGSAQPAAINNLNSFLRLSLIIDPSRNWNYFTTASGCAQATRNGNNGRTFSIPISNDDPIKGGGC